MLAIGLMSGTSLDGVDAALIETDGERIVRFGPTATLFYEDALRVRLRALLDAAPKLAVGDPEVARLSRIVADRHAEAVALLASRADLVGFHGQTILHDPANRRTWQIGDAAHLAHKTRLPVAHDFRSADVASGGEGAPLVPLFHAALAADLPKPLLVANIGGVANITFLGADGTILACDTGPGNGPLDDWVRSHTGADYDKDGALAGSGRVHRDRLDALMADPYFARQAPKSLDRLHFSARIAVATDGLSVEDGAATLAAFTATAIAAAPIPVAPKRILVSGGGRRNAAIMAALRDGFSVPVEPVEAVGWDGDALEAQCFGFLAVRVARGLPLSLPTTTGVARPMPGGRLAKPAIPGA
ncbi:anhydro-N-acetylmuramic acid kinase [Acidiphilium sp. AL]|uniref:anhydro-N-acetylmuramic acid kinase n=1 Tax=Acidiphilium sp. AL TaxID=2871704 RepID=UPI0021CB168F|nr:anhydro-N-acetylmuramic acid kinase [Acidiphilium sp. AL]MCU4161257.1 anhydro-N-acetylmuramic acid kinase [Acidiphilium sp. AL]